MPIRLSRPEKDILFLHNSGSKYYICNLYEMNSNNDDKMLASKLKSEIIGRSSSCIQQRMTSLPLIEKILA